MASNSQGPTDLEIAGFAFGTAICKPIIPFPDIKPNQARSLYVLFGSYKVFK
jgi:hypothetical protein